MDVKVFSRELLEEFKEIFPDYFEENNEPINQLLGAMSFIAALAIEKYDREIKSE